MKPFQDNAWARLSCGAMVFVAHGVPALVQRTTQARVEVEQELTQHFAGLWVLSEHRMEASGVELELVHLIASGEHLEDYRRRLVRDFSRLVGERGSNHPATLAAESLLYLTDRGLAMVARCSNRSNTSEVPAEKKGRKP